MQLSLSSSNTHSFANTLDNCSQSLYKTQKITKKLQKGIAEAHTVADKVHSRSQKPLLSCCQSATLQNHRVHTQQNCNFILHVIATDVLCQLLRFKYQMTPYYYSDEDKIFATFKFTATSKQQKLKEMSCGKTNPITVDIRMCFWNTIYHLSVFHSLSRTRKYQSEFDNEECRLRIIQVKIISFSYRRICHTGLGKNVFEHPLQCNPPAQHNFKRKSLYNGNTMRTY